MAETDLELLKLAAKAAGVDAEWHNDENAEFEARHEGLYLKGARSPDNSKYWNPLRVDGDALRLAMALGLVVDCSRPSAGLPYEHHAIWLDETMGTAELTRRAIVRAAAAIGRGVDE